MKTGIKVLLGVGAAAALYFFTREKKVGPFEKMAIDVLNPNTTAGKTQRSYLTSTGGEINEANLLNFVTYRQGAPNDTFTIAYTAKPSWGINEVVPV